VSARTWGWYRLVLLAVVAFALGMVLAAGGLYAEAVHARAVVQQHEWHAPPVGAA
jgi:autotransporter translocation and assembly factor TamB